MSDRKVYATVEGTMLVPLRVKRQVIIRVDEGTDTDAALRAAANGETGDDNWDLVDCGGCELQGTIDDVNEAVDNAVDDDANFQIDNVEVTDSK